MLHCILYKISHLSGTFQRQTSSSATTVTKIEIVLSRNLMCLSIVNFITAQKKNVKM